MTEKYRFFNDVVSGTLLALYRRPKFFEFFFSYSNVLSKGDVRQLILLQIILLQITLSLINNDGTFNGIRSGPKIDVRGTPQIISRLDVFIAPVC